MTNKIKQSLEEMAKYAFKTDGKMIMVYQLHHMYTTVDGWEENDLAIHGFTLNKVTFMSRKNQDGASKKVWISKLMGIYVNFAPEKRLHIAAFYPDKVAHTLADIHKKLMSNKISRKFFISSEEKASRNEKEMLSMDMYDMISSAGDRYTWKRVKTKSASHGHTEQKVVLTHVNGTYVKDIFEDSTFSELAVRIKRDVQIITLAEQCKLVDNEGVVSTTPYCINGV